MESFSRPELFDFKGVSMSSLFTSNWENVQNFQARNDDILIATYPKAGRLHQELPISPTNCALVRPPIRVRVQVSVWVTFRVSWGQTNVQFLGQMESWTHVMLRVTSGKGFAFMPNGEQCGPLFIFCVCVNMVLQERHGSPTSLISCILARKTQSVRHRCQSMTGCHFWSWIYRSWIQVDHCKSV